ncbi:transposase [Arthrobacter alpinus]
MEALIDKTTKKRYSFEFKLAIVHQFLEGEGTLTELAQMHQLSATTLLRRLGKTYREEGAEGLGPKPMGRPASHIPITRHQLRETRRKSCVVRFSDFRQRTLT